LADSTAAGSWRGVAWIWRQRDWRSCCREDTHTFWRKWLTQWNLTRTITP
jgi:hypothetical protein